MVFRKRKKEKRKKKERKKKKSIATNFGHLYLDNIGNK